MSEQKLFSFMLMLAVACSQSLKVIKSGAAMHAQWHALEKRW
jgi:hypothetical protein